MKATELETLGQDVIIGVGVQKSGTSSIANFFRRNGVNVPAEKELHAFKPMIELPKEEYLKRLGYSEDHKFHSEYTPNYLAHPTAIWNISKILPKAKIVVSLRNPVERAFSAYVHAVGDSYVSPETTFQEMLDTSLRGTNETWPRDLVRLGNYPKQLRRLFSYFPSQQVTVLNFQELIDESMRPQILRDLASWIGFDLIDDSFGKANQSGRYKAKIKPVTQELDPLAREKLLKHFRESVIETEKILGRKLNWGFD